MRSYAFRYPLPWEVDAFFLSRVAGQAQANGNQDRWHGFSLLDLDTVQDRSGDFHGVVGEEIREWDLGSEHQ